MVGRRSPPASSVSGVGAGGAAKQINFKIFNLCSISLQKKIVGISNRGVYLVHILISYPKFDHRNMPKW